MFSLARLQDEFEIDHTPPPPLPSVPLLGVCWQVDFRIRTEISRAFEIVGSLAWNCVSRLRNFLVITVRMLTGGLSSSSHALRPLWRFDRFAKVSPSRENLGPHFATGSAGRLQTQSERILSKLSCYICATHAWHLYLKLFILWDVTFLVRPHGGNLKFITLGSEARLSDWCDEGSPWANSASWRNVKFISSGHTPLTHLYS